MIRGKTKNRKKKTTKKRPVKTMQKKTMKRLKNKQKRWKVMVILKLQKVRQVLKQVKWKELQKRRNRRRRRKLVLSSRSGVFTVIKIWNYRTVSNRKVRFSLWCYDFFPCLFVRCKIYPIEWGLITLPFWPHPAIPISMIIHYNTILQEKCLFINRTKA